MKRIYTITLALLLAGMNAVAQQAQTQPATPVGSATLTLDQCIQYALENSINIKNAQLDERVSEARVKETVGIGLPQISGSVSLQHNQQLPRFFARYATAQGFAGVDDEGKPLLNIPGVNPTDVVAMQSPFQLKSSGSATAQINQLLFSGSYLVGLKASNTYKELSVKTTAQTKETTIEQVTKAFYSALINKERMQLFESNITRVDSLLRNTKALHANGFAESIDVDRIQVTLNNLITERRNFENLQQLSIELLKFQMNYPMNADIEVAGDLAEQNIKVDLNSYLNDWNYRNRPDYQLLEVNRKLQQLNVKNNVAANLPVLSAFANGGWMTQSNNIGGLFVTNTGIKDEGGIGPDKWYTISSYGLSMSIPIFSGLQRNYRTQQEKLKLQKIENSFKTLESSIDLQVRQASITYENAVQTLESQQRNMDLARNVARITQVKYEQGVGSNLEVVTAESSLKEAQINYYNALYDAMVAKTDLDKAFGKLLPTTNN